MPASHPRSVREYTDWLTPARVATSRCDRPSWSRIARRIRPVRELFDGCITEIVAVDARRAVTRA
jgi:hypothetical protein